MIICHYFGEYEILHIFFIHHALGYSSMVGDIFSFETKFYSGVGGRRQLCVVVSSTNLRILYLACSSVSTVVCLSLSLESLYYVERTCDIINII
jgi:hypothetical protein